MDQYEFTTVLALLETVSDPSKERGKIYPWVCLLAIICAALLSNQTNGSAIVQWVVEHWGDIRPGLPLVVRRMPSGSTLRRTLRLVDIKGLEGLVGEFVRRLDEQDGATGVITGLMATLYVGKPWTARNCGGPVRMGPRWSWSVSCGTIPGRPSQQRVQPGSSETVLARELLAK